MKNINEKIELTKQFILSITPKKKHGFVYWMFNKYGDSSSERISYIALLLVDSLSSHKYGSRDTKNNLLDNYHNHHLTDYRNSSKDHIDKLAFKLNTFGNEGEYAVHLKREMVRKKFNEYKEYIKRDKCDEVKQMFPDKSLISVEIECIILNQIAHAEIRELIYKHKLNVVEKDDASLRCNRDEITKEFVINFPNDDMSQLAMLCSIFKGRTRVNSSCGLHVHFDMRQYNYHYVLNLADELAKYVPALKRILPVSRRKNRYIKHAHNLEKKYSFINSRTHFKYKTLEIRGHSGTTDFVKISNWIYIMQYLMTACSAKLNGHTLDENNIKFAKKRCRSTKSLIKLLNSFNLPRYLSDYIKEREALFSGSPDTNEENTNENNITSSSSGVETSIRPCQWT